MNIRNVLILCTFLNLSMVASELPTPKEPKSIAERLEILAQKLRKRRKPPRAQEDNMICRINNQPIDPTSNRIVTENGQLLVTRAVSQEEQRKNRSHAFFETAAISAWIFGTTTAAGTAGAAAAGAGVGTAAAAAAAGTTAAGASGGFVASVAALFPQVTIPAITVTAVGYTAVKAYGWLKGVVSKRNSTPDTILQRDNSPKNKAKLAFQKVEAKKFNNNGPKDPKNNKPNDYKSRLDDLAHAYEQSKKLEEAAKYRIYEPNPKHHANTASSIGKEPMNGYVGVQKAIKVPEKDFLVGVENGKIVQYNQHGPNTYHGYIVENFRDLDPAAQQALVDEGLFRSVKSGKIQR